MNETCKSSLHSANVGVCTEGGLRFDAGAAAPPEPRRGEPLQGTMDRSRTWYQITEETEQSDGSVIVRVRKQYSDRADVSEYFN